MQILTWKLWQPDSGGRTTSEINKNLFLTQTMTLEFLWTGIFFNIIRMGETYSHLSYKQQKMCGYRQGTLTEGEG